MNAVNNNHDGGPWLKVEKAPELTVMAVAKVELAKVGPQISSTSIAAVR